MRREERLNVMGVGISAINLAAAVDSIRACIANGEKKYVCVANVHSVVECQGDALLRREINEAGLVTPDGMPLVWLLRLAGYPQSGRVYGPALMLALMEAGCALGYRHFLYGATTKTLDRLQENLRRRFPRLLIAGSIAPPFRLLSEEEDERAVQAINDSGAQIVWVGLGAPKQEHWIAQHSPRLRANVLIGVGAAFDFHAGNIPQAPAVLQRCGLEWTFRLAMEPRRLWRRYATSNPKFVAGVLAQGMGLRRYELDL